MKEEGKGSESEVKVERGVRSVVGRKGEREGQVGWLEVRRGRGMRWQQ